MEIVGLIVCLIAGGIVGWLLRDKLVKGISSGNNSLILDEKAELQKRLDDERDTVLQLTSDFSKVQELNRNLSVQHEKIEKDFAVKFENLANKIFEEKSVKFTAQNKENIGDLLSPLKERLSDFEKKVVKSNNDNLEWNSALRQQIKGLEQLNLQMTKDAENLTKALKGDSKIQGDWGEMQLELLLEKAGLVKGTHYSTQGGFKDEEGQLKKPDFVVNLPEGKHLIIDSKVSLVDYERYSSGDESEKPAHLKKHIQSIRAKVKDLSSKNYQGLGVHSPDYVMMYIPVEPAFHLAVQNDENLFFEALEKNIVLVSTSTLLATMRTISFIWKQERQNRHVLEIAKQSGLLYDKFVGFTEDLIKVGQSMDRSKSMYEDAMNKLSTGKGNLVKKADEIKKLGAKANKQLEAALVERSKD